jgi:hypothetical protein
MSGEGGLRRGQPLAQRAAAPFKAPAVIVEYVGMPLSRPINAAAALAAALALCLLAGFGGAAQSQAQGGGEGLSAIVSGPVEAAGGLLGAADGVQDRAEREGWRELRAREEAVQSEAAADPGYTAGEDETEAAEAEAQGEAAEAELAPEEEPAPAGAR